MSGSEFASAFYTLVEGSAWRRPGATARPRWFVSRRPGHGPAMSSVSPRPPHRAYAGLIGMFLIGIAGLGVLSRRHEEVRYAPTDFLVLALATFKASRTLARDDVTRFMREPFIEGAPTVAEHEHPVPSGGVRQALGELVTCSRCLGMWAGAGLVAVDLAAPAFGRPLRWSLAVAGANDWLQAGFAGLTSAANRIES